MPKDTTFTDKDVIRIYCNNLSAFERKQVRKWFDRTKGKCDGTTSESDDKKRAKDDVKTIEESTNEVKVNINVSNGAVWGLIGYLLGDDETKNDRPDNVEVSGVGVFSELEGEKDKVHNDVLSQIKLSWEEMVLPVRQELKERELKRRLTFTERLILNQEIRENVRTEVNRIDQTFKLYPYIGDTARGVVKSFGNNYSSFVDLILDLEDAVLEANEDLRLFIEGEY